MVYIYKEKDNIIVTDNVIAFSPNNLTIMIDDEELAFLNNISNDPNYFKFVIDSALLTNFNYGEHKMILKYNGKIIKTEIIMIASINDINIVEVNKPKKIINYEK